MERRIFSEEHVLFRDAVRRYVTEEVVPQYESWQRGAQVPRAEWKKAAQRGLLCPSAPPELGGAGADFLYSVAIRSLATIGRPTMHGFCTLKTRRIGSGSHMTIA